MYLKDAAPCWDSGHRRTRSDPMARLFQRQQKPPGAVSRLRQASDSVISFNSHRDDPLSGRPTNTQTLPSDHP